MSNTDVFSGFLDACHNPLPLFTLVKEIQMNVVQAAAGAKTSVRLHRILDIGNN
jgi:hypothetical protein